MGKFITKNLGLSIAAALLLAGCAAQWPQAALLNPLVPDARSTVLLGTQVTMEGIDKRLATHIFTIEKIEQPLVRINSAEPLNVLMAARLAQGLRSQGLEVGNAGATHLILAIEQAEVRVKEQTITYATSARVGAQVIVEGNGRRLTKQFNLASNSEAPGEPSIADLEGALNRQLSRLIEQIMRDEQLRRYLQGRTQ
ncbi:MAG: YajG family lipoprotein [Aeromonas sp.]